MIKHLSITTAIIFLWFGQLYAQTTAQQIGNISKHVTRVNTIKLQSKHYEFICDEKMKVDYYYDKGQIVKISLDYGTIGDVYAREDHYYQNGKLIFVYEFVEGGPACEGCVKKHEYRSYIYNNKVIRYLKDRSATKCRKCEFGPTSKQYKLMKVKTESEIKRVLCGIRG